MVYFEFPVIFCLLQCCFVQCISCNMVSKTEDFKKGDIILIVKLFEFRGEVANCSNFAQVVIKS